MKFQKYNKFATGTAEEKVLSYIATHDHKPLILSYMLYNAWNQGVNLDGQVTPPQIDTLSLQRLIVSIMREADNRRTLYLISKKPQCRAGARRSAFDIWRVAKTYNPNVDLFEVMRLMYSRSVSVHYYRSYCYVVRKRVFDYNPFGDSHYQQDDESLDEFGLTFSQWRTIGVS